MSRNSTKKKRSTSKYRKLKISPLIPVIAIIEVLVLVAISSYAWFYKSADKEVQVGIITVDADSGLDIDFKYAKEEDYINIWNYIDKDFKFEPVTSLDGRNVFVPTTGTMDSTTTSNMVFREGTVNDINSKYINIDFELTNTTDYDMKVYLNNNSFFNVKDRNTGANDESRALRLAFYPNDASKGNVSSQLIGGSSDYANQEEHQTTGTVRTVYFDNTKWENNQASKNWDKVYVYLWRSSDNAYQYAWPGIEMSRFSGPIYKYSYSEEDVVYDKIIFNNGSGSKTSDLTLYDNGVYTSSGYIETFTPNTIYFVKPNTWDNVYVHAWRTVNGSDQYYTNWSGTADGLDEMKHVGSGIYSYTFNASNGDSGVRGLLFTNGSYGASNQTVNVSVPNSTTVNDKIYYVNGVDSNNVYTVTTYGTNYSAMSSKTLYFYNSLGWEIPYCTGSTAVNYNSLNTINVAMTSLTGNVYYCNLPEIYGSVFFRDRDNDSKRTISIPSGSIPLTDGYVYRSLSSKTGSYYNVDCFQYADYTDTGGFAVISPGVSAGFQRVYTPVVSIDNSSGDASQVIPAFANSIDNYIYGNTAGTGGTSQTVFDIQAKHILSLSMVIWLEGTDPACTGEAYAGNNIELRLEFASSYTDTSVTPNVEHNVNTYGSETYTYKFYDKTREVWTSDRQATESGVTVAPVMQLYDNTIERGYLMHPSKYVTVDGKTKVSCWEVNAPQNIALWGHDIIFRRVNPYDEDEVWNYWHAGRVAGGPSDPVYTNRKNTTTYPIYSLAFSGGNTISFTAFADGSPTYDMLKNNVSTTNADNAQVPDVSCGGLWGNHSVRTLTLIDNTRFHACKQSDGKGIVTISFSYRYTSSGASRDVKIEYKSSGPNDDIYYYFVVPDVIYTANDPNEGSQGLKCTFKNYKKYDSDYAINSPLNDEIEYVERYAVSDRPCGDYIQLNQSPSGNYHYWGSDILYIRTTNNTSDYMLTDTGDSGHKNQLMQVKYYCSSDTRYSYLYAVTNDTVKDSAPSAYVSVVPNKYRYETYQVMNVQYTNPNNHYYTTGTTAVSHTATETITNQTNYGSSNKTIYRNHLSNNNLISLDHMYIRIYVDIQDNLDLLSSNPPDIYLWNGTTNNTWPGQRMSGGTHDTSSSPHVYRYYFEFDVPKYTKFQIVKSGDDTKKSQAFSGTLSPSCNQNVYRITAANNWYPDYVGNGADWGWSGLDKTRTVATTGPTTTSLPHFAAS